MCMYLDTVAVAVHDKLPAAAGDAPGLDHRLEVSHMFHMLVHIGSQYLKHINPLTTTVVIIWVQL